MRMVVCGTTFGQVYLDALGGGNSQFRLAGVLAAGSTRSQRIAAERGVPLYTSVDQLPDDVVAACVVVRSGLLGGAGTTLAEALLARGVHVLQEHPVHHDELVGCLRLARRHGVQYHLNTFYEHLDAVRRFRAAATTLLRSHRPLFVDATVGFPVAFALLDVIGTVLGGLRPWSFGPVVEAPESAALLRVLTGRVAGLPATLRVAHQLDPEHPDNPTHQLMGLDLGVDGGTLHLVTAHGPVVWAARPRLPGAAREARPGTPAVTVLGPTCAPPFDECVASLWPDAVRHAIDELATAVTAGSDPLRRGQRHLGLCRAWQDLAGRLGPPELTTLRPGAELSAADLDEMAAAAQGVRSAG